MTFPEIMDALKNVGVPAGIAAFVLWRLDKTLRDLLGEVRAFREVMQASSTALERHVTERTAHIVDTLRRA